MWLGMVKVGLNLIAQSQTQLASFKDSDITPPSRGPGNANPGSTCRKRNANDMHGNIEYDRMFQSTASEFPEHVELMPCLESCKEEVGTCPKASSGTRHGRMVYMVSKDSAFAAS